MASDNKQSHISLPYEDTEEKVKKPQIKKENILEVVMYTFKQQPAMSSNKRWTNSYFIYLFWHKKTKIPGIFYVFMLKGTLSSRKAVTAFFYKGQTNTFWKILKPLWNTLQTTRAPRERYGKVTKWLKVIKSLTFEERVKNILSSIVGMGG